MANKIALQTVKSGIKAATNAIVVGETYFLSDFFEKSGYMVKVTAKSTKLNSAGWPSTVSFQVLEVIGGAFRKVGYVGSCNATNLYTDRAMAAQTVAVN